MVEEFMKDAIIFMLDNISDQPWITRIISYDISMEEEGMKTLIMDTAKEESW